MNIAWANGPIAAGVKLTADGYGTAVHITGTVLPPFPCKINNDQASPIVDFGSDVRTDLIDGKTYDTKVLPVKVTCDGDPGAVMQFSLKGTATDFDSAALKTNIDGLGIKIYNGADAMDINSWGNINYDEPLNLTVVPVKSKLANLQGGDFSTTGTLIMRIE
ncbi:hypothetical protein M975_2589 [Buttiauxella brennerae ATCC 51605]|uniref:Fimbrial-type adhesion domain-containing protein n=2 Tax=Buttiauxella TaxID=82976 RepID=A0A1B7INK3_9ENTR|nr:hypothetical protein M975_2589 [Buttiauxella brennerae ATCC 51605]